MPGNRFDLSNAITTWRHSLQYNRTFSADDLDELEQHFRDQVAALVAEGYHQEQAYRMALSEMGDYGTAEAEYRKVYWGKLRRHRQLANELIWRLTMLKNYLKIALRTMRKEKGNTLINITGLAVGLACSLFIVLWIVDEVRYDRFLEEGDRVYQVVRNVNVGDDVFTWRATSKPLAEVLETQYPAISNAVFSFGQEFVVTMDDQKFREMGNYAGAAFFDVFQFPFIQGDPSTALTDVSSVVLTDRMARRLFGENWQQGSSVLGRSLTIDHRKEFTVTGVIRDIPAQSSYQTDLILPIQDFFDRNEWVETWGNNSFPLYVKLAPGASPETVSEQIAQVVNEHEEGADEVLFLQAYEDLYLYSTYEQGQLVGGRIDYVRIFAVVALFLVLIACINFMNLATARSARRVREIGVRKALGASRSSLSRQFLMESVLTALLALVFAVLLIVMFLPFFNDLTGKQITMTVLNGPVLVFLLILTLGVGFLAGSYPALYLSSFNSLDVLRGSVNNRPGGAMLRKGLVVFQFTLSVLLIIATLAVDSQVDFIRDRDLGLSRDHIVYLPQEGALKDQYETVRQELLQQPGITHVTAASMNPLAIRSSTSSVTWEGKDPEAEYEVSILISDYDFVETMDMDLLAGRSFSRDFSTENAGFVINEEMASLIGGREAVGTQLSFWGGLSGSVIGIVKNFEMNSIYNPVAPVIIWLSPENTSLFYARIAPEQTEEALAGLEAVFNQFNPDYPFNYTFLDQEFETRYRSETVLGKLSNFFALIAIFISCLGLFGLISYSAEQRTKEIGVRKVLGARVAQLVMLLVGDITKLVLVGIVLAIPIAYLTVNNWLTRFAYHVDMGAGLFLLAGLAAILIAWFTVSYQAVKAALADPVDSLRYE